MNCIRWAAWGVVDIENIPSDQTTGGNRQARRSYLKKVHAELATVGMKLHIGGSAANPWYCVEYNVETAKVAKQVCAGKDAFKKICTWVLEQIGDHTQQGDADVGSENGGLRRAGDEAQGSGV